MVASDPEEGGAVAAYVDGRVALDLWGGLVRRGEAWRRDTIVQTFSVVKGVTATVVLALHDRRLLDVDAPVASVWPEFAAAGKGAAPIASILTHTLGLPWLDDYESVATLDDPASWRRVDEIVRRLAAAAPASEPGTRSGYHSITGGILLGEVVRRATGRSLGAWLRDEIADPLGLDLRIGLPPERHARTATLVADPQLDSDDAHALVNPRTPVGKALFVGPRRRIGTAFAETYAARELVEVELPSTSGIGNARGLARLHAALACGGELDGVRVASPASIELFAGERVCGRDAVWPVEFRVALGFLRPHEPFAFSPTDEAFGHPGVGGSVAFADPVRRLGFAFVTRRLDGRFRLDERAARLVGAVYAALP